MPLRRLFLSTSGSLSRPIAAQAACFHTASAWRSDTSNHYETLGVEPSASPTVIKKQFYSLSKTHHPDHNPKDPKASDRFVKISEAYAILGSPAKRERYDRDIQRAHGRHSEQTRHGSHSSSSTPFGSRPASGLSRRRTQFRGPPPSFYRSGGWGARGSNRHTQAEESGAGQAGRAKGSANPHGGFGPGQGQAGFSNDVPHFDHDSHFRTQEQQEKRRRRRMEDEEIGYSGGGSVFFRFLLISSVVAFACSTPYWGFGGDMRPAKTKNETT